MPDPVVLVCVKFFVNFINFGSLGFLRSLYFVLDFSCYLLVVEQDNKVIKSVTVLKEGGEHV